MKKKVLRFSTVGCGGSPLFRIFLNSEEKVDGGFRGVERI